MAVVSGLWIFPLKGARGINVSKAKVTATGFAFDRHWLIVGDRSGRFETQRNEPRLALIETHIPEHLLSGASTDCSSASLTLKAPGQGALKIPLIANKSVSLRKIKVWDWSGEGLDEGDAAADYLSKYFDKPVRLVRYAGNPATGTPETEITRRQVDTSWAPAATETAFSDGFPFLLGNEFNRNPHTAAGFAQVQASLEDLNTHLDDKLPMVRFRPNIIIRGVSAWEEDQWQQFRIGDACLESVKPCDRCKVTTIDQNTAKVSVEKEPLKALAKIRSGSVLGWDKEEPKWKNAVFFGWNLILKSGAGIVSVGDMVEGMQRRAGPVQPMTSS